MTGTEWAGWISAVGTAVAAIASAVAAWQSAKSSRAAAEEARRLQEQAQLTRRQVALERMLLTAESLSADMRRAIMIASEIKQGASIAMIASGVYQSSSKEEGYKRADAWQQEIKELTAIALRVINLGPSDTNEMTLEQVEAIRLDMLRAKERVVVVLEDMERDRQSWQNSIDQLTRVNASRASQG